MILPEFLSDPAWQGIGVILALVVAVLPAGARNLWKRKQRAEEERKVIHVLGTLHAGGMKNGL
jgi:hypothetical protein